ncbi:hypothetical protein DICPUDRAFT_81716 [Dictyostelium purpureum]|uniref:Uncharacterized protein n=1 Tax=Dictyostelium purpureum TaxID=5786 RepID=F0ZUD1_DICPU|nr:uncharacterized protein DICPUDRAFT_81716 [Dictyostelium purpureum]EGC32456.1 hypothetical protein DICPUDRAFT_81716 [Dictyostelium purpureum]|eukprot:XP_003291028.1 hypothetical protein DICPUDRAFT_81716 [Dictyostelium purpureum]
MLPNYILKIIIKIICNHINYHNKSLKFDSRKNDEPNKQLTLNLALVSHLFFDTVSSLLDVSVNFNYDPSFYSFIKDLVEKKVEYVDSLPSYNSNIQCNNNNNNNNKYSIIKIENVKSIRLDYIFLFGDSYFCYQIYEPNQIGRGFRLIKFSLYSEIFKKIKEIKQLKRILIRNFTNRCANYSFKIDDLIQMGYKNIQFSEICILQDSNLNDIKPIKKINSLIIYSNFGDGVYDSVKQFEKNLERLVFKSEKPPIKQLAGIHVDQSKDNFTVDYKHSSAIQGINYFRGIKNIVLESIVSFDNLNTIMECTPCLLELNFTVCFNHLIFSLSSEDNLKQLGYKSDYYCIGGCCEERTQDEKREKSKKKKQDVLQYFPLLLESSKNNTTITKIVLNHNCKVFPKRMDSSDVINNKHMDRRYSSFLESFTKFIISLPLLDTLIINGINNPIIFKYLIQTLKNKNIQNYHQTLGFSWLPFEQKYNKVFDILVKENEHIKSFKYYSQAIRGYDVEYYYNYNKE